MRYNFNLHIFPSLRGKKKHVSFKFKDDKYII